MQGPGGVLWVAEVEVGEKVGIRQHPQTTRVVGHAVGRASNEIVARNIAEPTLM